MADRVVSSVFDSEFMAMLERLSIRAKKIFAGLSQGTSPTVRLGASVEFSDLRRYSPGDDFRYIDWNAFARFDELFLKLFREEGDVCLYLLIDASSSMSFGSPTKLLYAKQLAAALAYVALSDLNRASVVMLRDNKCEGLQPLKGKKQIFRVFRFLEGQKSRGGTSLQTALRVFGAEAKHTGQVILISDLMDESDVVDGLCYLKYLGFEPRLAHLLSPEEMNPSFDPGVTVSDSETGREVPVSDLPAYARERDAFIETLSSRCARSDIPYLLASTATALESLLLEGGITALARGTTAGVG